MANAGEWRYIEAAQTWVADRAGLVEAFACWVGTMPELVIAAYIDYEDRHSPPNEVDLDREELMSLKQYHRIKKLMPLRDFGWYQHNDPSCTLYKTVYVFDDEDDEEEGAEEAECRADAETVTEEDVVVDDDGASHWEDEDAADSDAETVTGTARRRSSA